jgi:hypothetical protein
VGEFEIPHPSAAALSLKILIFGVRICTCFAVRAEARLRRQMGEVCVPGSANCDFGWAGLVCNGMRSVNNKQKQKASRSPSAARCILADGDHAILRFERAIIMSVSACFIYEAFVLNIEPLGTNFADVMPDTRRITSRNYTAHCGLTLTRNTQHFFHYAKRLWSGNQGCYHSPSECYDSSFCFTVIRTRSSEERVLSTATLRTILPFNPVSPACFDPLTVMM